MYDLISKSKRSTVYYSSAHNTVHKVDSLPYEQCKSEAEIIRNLNIVGVPKFLGEGKVNNSNCFIYNYIKGSLLSALKLSTRDKLQVALRLIQLISSVHRNGVVHQCVHPENIIVDTNSLEVAILDFRLASYGESEATFKYEFWHHNAHTLSPEQTGLFQTLIDHRSDLYSLGCTLFFLFYGRHVFEKTDTFEMIRSHLAEKVEKPLDGHYEDKLLLFEIIAQLIEKKPEQRYQSINSLLEDFKFLAANWNDEKAMNAYEICTTISLATFKFEDEIIPRAQEQKLISEEFEKVKNGESRNVVLRGESGSGKTTFINDWHYSVLKYDPIWIQAKSLQYDNSLSRPVLVQLLDALANNLLALNKTTLDIYAKLIAQSLGSLVADLCSWVPAFRNVFTTDWRSKTEQEITQAILEYIFKQIVFTSASNLRPLIIFVDDYQWIDPWSTSVLEDIVKSRQGQYIFLIVAERPNFTRNSEKFKSLLVEIKPLAIEQIRERLARYYETGNVDETAEIIKNKTGGNPFYVSQLIKYGQENGIFNFSHDKQKWETDMELLASLNITDNVATLLDHKFNGLSDHEKQLLKIATCLSAEFSRELVRGLFLTHNVNVDISLRNLANNQFLLAKNNTYKFSHDRLEATVVNSFEKDEKIKIHYKIGQFLRDNRHLQEFPYQHIFQLNKSPNSLTNDEYTFAFLENLEAGKHYFLENQFELAYHFLKHARKFVGDQDWILRYKDRLHLNDLLAKTSMVVNDKETVVSCVEETNNRSQNEFDKLIVNEVKLDYFTELHQFDDGIDHLINTLNRLGFELERRPSKLRMARELIMSLLITSRKSVTKLTELPRMTDRGALAFQKLTLKAVASIFGAAPDLMPIVIFKQIQLSLKYGNSEYSPFSYVSYGFALSAFMNNINKGEAFGKLAINLLEKVNALEVNARTNVIYYGFLSMFKHGYNVGVSPLEKAYHVGMQTGDHTYAAFAKFFIGELRFFHGFKLQKLDDHLHDDYQIVHSLNQELNVIIIGALRQLVLDFSQKEDNSLDYDYLCSDDVMSLLIEKKDNATLFHLYIFRCIHMYYNEDFKMSKYWADESLKYYDDSFSRQPSYPFFVLFSSLSSIINSKKEKSAISKHERAEISKNLRILKRFAKNNPTTFYSMYYVLKAEYLSFQKKNNATTYYEKSVDWAMKNENIIPAALCCELYAKYNRHVRNNALASYYFQKSYEYYLKWGHKSKVDQLKGYFDDFLSNEFNEVPLETKLDLQAVIQLNKALSSAQTLEELTQHVTDALMANAVADRVLILINNEQQVLVPAGDFSKTKTSLNEPLSNEIYPQSLVSLALNTKSIVHSDQLAGSATVDSYLHKRKDLKYCCIPIIKDKTMGVVYLESTNLKMSFDDQFLKMLKTMVDQLSVSLENILFAQKREELAEIEKNYRKDLLTTSLVSQETERSRIAKELHDGVGGNLSGIKRKLENIQTDYVFIGHFEKRTFEEATILIDITIKEVRQISHDLMPATLLNIGLIGALKEFADFMNNVENFACHFYTDNWPEHVADKYQIMIYRIIQESMSNTLKHARASESYMQLSCSDNQLIVSYEDNGVGFDQRTIKAGLGIKNIESRVLVMNGTLELSSRPGKGTHLIIHIPLNEVVLNG